MVSLFAWLPLLAESNLTYVLMCAAILVLTIPLLLRLYRYQSRLKRRGSNLPTRHQATTHPRDQLANAPDNVIRWEVGMQELARDLKAEIDSKMIALGHLIRDADRAAERLEKALNSASETDEDSVAIRRPVEPNGIDNAALRDDVYTLADYGFSVSDIASRLATPVGQVELILRLREQGN